MWKKGERRRRRTRRGRKRRRERRHSPGRGVCARLPDSQRLVQSWRTGWGAQPRAAETRE
eukprot:7027035-Pyramimonas_sp.AAC.1